MENLSLKDFLKKYTAISNTFIDEYYLFYERCENEIYGIDAELVVEYLEYKDVKKFYERLRENYKVNNDYIIKRVLNPGSKTAKRVQYLLSFDCFEKICMLSRTQQADSVRDYFIILRKFINYYKNHFADKINHLATTKKYIYILMVNKNKNILKIGRANDMRKRLYQYATGKDKHPDVKFIMIVDDPIRVENCIKSLTSEFKFRNKQELYKIDFDVMKSVVFECANMSKSLDDKILDREKYDTYIMYDEYDEYELLDLNDEVVGYGKKQKTFKFPKASMASKGSKKGSKKSKTLKGSKKSKTLKGSKKSKTLKGSKKSKTLKGSKKSKTLNGSKKSKTLKGSKKSIEI